VNAKDITYIVSFEMFRFVSDFVGMGMGGNGNELSGIVWEWEWVSQCINFGNGNGNDHVGMGGIGNTESHSRTPLARTIGFPLELL